MLAVLSIHPESIDLERYMYMYISRVALHSASRITVHFVLEDAYRKNKSRTA